MTAAPQLHHVNRALTLIRLHGPSLPRVQELLLACGFPERDAPCPRQLLAPHDPCVLAFPRNEKPIAFFVCRKDRPTWPADIYPLIGKCWDPRWTGSLGLPGATGRAVVVTNCELRAYALPVGPGPDQEVEPSGTRTFDEAQKWSSDLLFLTSGAIHASSYLEFMNEPTAVLRETANDNLVSRLESWSNCLAQELAKSRKRLTTAEADEWVRHILDQLLFVRFCEDRGVTTLNRTLFDLRDERPDWPGLRSLIGEYKHILNGDIFAPEFFADEIVDWGLIQEILLRLYQDFSFEVIPSEVLGRSYERRLSHRLEWRLPAAKYVEDAKLRKQYGIYYTPESVAKYLAVRALEIWSPRRTKPLEQVRFLDPCAGSGTFLVQGFRALLRALQAARGGPIPIKERAQLLGTCVFGLDVQPLPLERSAMACYFEALSGQGVASGQRLLPRLLKNNLLRRNARQLRTSLPAGFQADIVLLNPPYTGHRKATSDCWTILLQAIQHLPENGVLGAIVPDALLRNNWLGDVRKEILDSAAVEEFGLIRMRVFEEADIRPILLLLRKVKEQHLRMAHVPRSVLVHSIDPEVVAVPVERNANQAALVRPPLFPFNVHVTDAVSQLQTRLLGSARFGKLAVFLRCRHGIANPPAAAVRKACETPVALGPSEKLLIQGKDIKPFGVEWGRRVIDYEKTKELAKKKESHIKTEKSVKKEENPIRPRDPAIFEVPCKLLVRESGSIITAALDFERRYADNKVIVCLPRPDACNTVMLHFLLGYLNCELAWLWFRTDNPQYLAYMPTIRQSELEALWVPIHLDQVEKTRIAVLAHRIAATLASGFRAADDEIVVGMRRQLLARLALQMELKEKEVNLILDFVGERNSVAERPFQYPRPMPDVPFVELLDRPLDQQRGRDLLSDLPLPEEELKRKEDWEDVINGPLPDIYEQEPDPEDIRLGRELKALAERLDRVKRLLKGEDAD